MCANFTQVMKTLSSANMYKRKHESRNEWNEKSRKGKRTKKGSKMCYVHVTTAQEK